MGGAAIKKGSRQMRTKKGPGQVRKLEPHGINLRESPRNITSAKKRCGRRNDPKNQKMTTGALTKNPCSRSDEIRGTKGGETRGTKLATIIRVGGGNRGRGQMELKGERQKKTSRDKACGRGMCLGVLPGCWTRLEDDFLS